MSRSVAPAEPDAAAAPHAEARAGLRLAAGGLGFAGLAGAGLLMWAAQGEDVFAQVVLVALAWCF